jgi:hypothetical protein
MSPRPRVVLSNAAIALVTMASLGAESKQASVEFSKGAGKVAVAIDGLPIAMYCYNDERITRPYFAHIRAPSGIQVSRNHPPTKGFDLTDHDTFHPGIWMSFGDISGSDFWRIKARVRHARFVDEPRDGRGKGSFAVENDYLDEREPSRVICKETARYSFLPRPEGFFLLWDSTFSSDKEFYFGDQEEMGLGVRVNTAIRVGASGQEKVPPGNGTIRDSEGRENEKQIWGNAAKWCDYSGTIASQHVGMTIFVHPGNLRPSWFHARDYGLLEANQFGRNAFHKGEISKVVVRAGEKLQLRYGVLIHSDAAESKPDLGKAYRDYVELAGN